MIYDLHTAAAGEHSEYCRILTEKAEIPFHIITLFVPNQAPISALLAPWPETLCDAANWAASRMATAVIRSYRDEETGDVWTIGVNHRRDFACLRSRLLNRWPILFAEPEEMYLDKEAVAKFAALLPPAEMEMSAEAERAVEDLFGNHGRVHVFTPAWTREHEDTELPRFEFWGSA
jgi:hypothetical protein